MRCRSGTAGLDFDRCARHRPIGYCCPRRPALRELRPPTFDERRFGEEIGHFAGSVASVVPRIDGKLKSGA